MEQHLFLCCLSFFKILVDNFNTDMSYNLITILGPTAAGKTKLAAKLANEFNGEIISADSRQVYIGMDIGTGKDFDEFKIGDK